ncbi:MAG: glycerophosphodiester phosphodiesterase family protein [Clostridia bacterium]|nr:glycerophosphodiester phosphodiesterase family protein [Clostridia bacterium]
MKKLYLLLLALILVLPACSPAEIPEETSAEAETTAQPETPVYIVASDKQTAYTIIRPDVFDERALQATIALRHAINEQYSVDILINTDWSKEAKDGGTVTSDETVLEVLVGDTNRAETRDVAEEYSDVKCGYVIKAVNGKIVIWGTEVATLCSAIEYFIAEMLGGESISVERDYVYVWNLSGEGMPLDLLANNYSIIIPTGSAGRIKDVSDGLATKFFKLAGTRPEIIVDKRATDKSGKEILIGDTDRPESAEVGAGLKYMDYAIRIYENKIVLVGGSPFATQNAVNDFIAMLTEGKLTSLEAGFEYKKDYHSLFADSLAFNQESFVPKWANEFTPPSWMLDFDEKTYALTTSDGRMMGDAHRGDVQHYPENSLEAILSALMMGADVVEIDVRLTKDNIMVLMHDATLKRTTNWQTKAGKNGLPSSANIEDWTYEQLQELSLIHNGMRTECKIPTFYEACLLFVGRGFIHYDNKVGELINKDSDLYLLAEETGSKACFAYNYGASTMMNWLAKDTSDTEFKNFAIKFKEYATGHSLRKRNFDMIAKHGDHITGWKKAWDEGYNMTFTNKIYDFSRYIAENCEPFIIN